MEQAFVVIDQAREHIRSIEREIVRKSSIECDFECTVKTSGSSETADGRVATGLVLRIAVRTAKDSWRDRFTWIEKKVGITVVERAVFDNRALSTINAAEPEAEIVP